jgi:HEAT repeat protein
MTMKTMKLAAAFAVLCAASPAFAGKGGSAALISSAIQSGSTDAIIAEVERTEALMCPDCIQLVTNLTEDNRYAVREVAAWWFAKRPGLNVLMTSQMLDDLKYGDAVHVRNAADYLGGVVSHNSIPALTDAMNRGNLTADAKLAIVRAIRVMTNKAGNAILVVGMSDADAGVRAASAAAWREISGQVGAAPVVGLLTDGDANVRAQAAQVVGAMGEVNAHGALEVLVVNDADPVVRRNAAWALGKLGQASSRTALTTATLDKSGLVRNFAQVALTQLH